MARAENTQYHIEEGDLQWILSELQDLAHTGNAFSALTQVYEEHRRRGEDTLLALKKAITALLSPGLRRLPGYAPAKADDPDAKEIQVVRNAFIGLANSSIDPSIRLNRLLSNGHVFGALICESLEPLLGGEFIGRNRVTTIFMLTERGERKDSRYAFTLLEKKHNHGLRDMSVIEGFAEEKFYHPQDMDYIWSCVVVPGSMGML